MVGSVRAAPFGVLLIFIVLIASEDAIDGVRWPPPPRNQCQKITIPLCQDLGYNLTVMPNLMGNQNQLEAEKELQKYAVVVASRCSPHVRFFLCSAFVPLCSEHVAGGVGGCRALCERAREECRAQLPASESLPAFRCERYPPASDTLCMRLPEGEEPAPPPTPAPRPATRPPARAASAPSAPEPLCADEAFADAWTAAWAWVSFASTLFALLTFCMEPSRFRYPERPAVYMCACHCAAALAQLAPRAPGVAPRAHCALVALADDFCATAGAAWFCALAAAWYLSAARDWSAEALERAAPRFHLAAWGTAAFAAGAALVWGSTACGGGAGGAAAAASAATPRLVALAFAGALAARAGVALSRVRRTLASPPALSRLSARLAAFALSYGLLAGAAAVAAAAAAASAGLCGVASLARPALAQWAGAAAGARAWSGKSCRVWGRALARLTRRAPEKRPLPRSLQPLHLPLYPSQPLRVSIL